MSSWPPKDPDEVLDYQIDWADPVDGPRLVTGETLLTSVFSVASGSVTINSSAFVAGGLATVWLSGGTAGTTCAIQNRVTTSAGRTYEKTVRLRVRNSH